MRILVTGREGQLARSLSERGALHAELEVECVGRPELDLSERGSVAAAIQRLEPDLVINAAAYTAVDQAESEPDLAYSVNADGAGEIARAAHDIGAGIIQISTDYVFDGKAAAPYREEAPTNPLGVYGSSKLAGEEQVRSGNPDHLIIRTSWVYSPFGRNFLKTMLRLAADHDEVRVVADQIGCPTSALDVADAILAAAQSRQGRGRTYHVAGRGSCTWAQFAEEIFRRSSEFGGPFAAVVPIPTTDFPTPAARPHYSVLDSSRFEQEFGFVMQRWEDSTREIVGRLARG